MACRSIKRHNHFGKTTGSSYKAKPTTTLEPAIPTLSIQTNVHEKTCIGMFVIAQNWKHPECQFVGVSINKSWHIYK